MANEIFNLFIYSIAYNLTNNLIKPLINYFLNVENIIDIT